MNSIQNNLKSKLKELHISAAELSRRSGVHHSSIKNIIYGKVEQPRKVILSRISNALGVPPEDLLFERTIHKVANDQSQDQTYPQAIDVMQRTLKQHHIELDTRSLKEHINQLYFYAKLRKMEDTSINHISTETAELVIQLFHEIQSNSQ
jgi:transcriptional regulator with XRE-family HTH domain